MINRSQRIYEQLTKKLELKESNLSHFTSLTPDEWEILIKTGAQYGVRQNIRFIQDYFQKLIDKKSTYIALYDLYLKSEMPSSITITQEQEVFLDASKNDLDNPEKNTEVKKVIRALAISNADFVIKILNSIDKDVLQFNLENPTISSADKLVHYLTKTRVKVLEVFGYLNDEDWTLLRQLARKGVFEENILFLQDYFNMLRGKITRHHIYENYIRENCDNPINIDAEISKVLSENDGQSLDQPEQVQKLRKAAKNIASLVLLNISQKYGSSLKEALTEAGLQGVRQSTNTKRWSLRL